MSRDPSARRPEIPLAALEADIRMNRLGCRQGVDLRRSRGRALIRNRPVGPQRVSTITPSIGDRTVHWNQQLPRTAVVITCA